jgi:cytochrome P450
MLPAAWLARVPSQPPDPRSRHARNHSRRVGQPGRVRGAPVTTDAAQPATGANPFEAAVTGSPHEVFGQLREAGPVHRSALPNGAPIWLVTRYAEARAAMSDPRLSCTAGAQIIDVTLLPPGIRAGIVEHMLNVDPPDHTRLRSLASAVFTPRRVAALRPRVQRITDDLLDRLDLRERAELIADLAYPLPIQVICELLGIPAEEQASFRLWSTAFMAGLGAPVFPVAEVTEFVGYLRALVDRKRAAPDDALLSAMIAVRDAGEALTDNELTSMIFLLIIAGHETTVNLIGNGVQLVLSDPALAERLRTDPAGLAPAVEEFLRFEPPVPITSMRVTTAPVELGGTTIPAGEIVMVSLLAANRDGAAFAEAGQFQPARSGGPHLAFGHGNHYCLGAPLARLEGQIAIGTLLRRFPALRLAIDPSEFAWRPGVFMRGLLELPVILR